MKKKEVVLTLIVLILSGIAALIGLLSSTGAHPFSFTSITGEIVTIYGNGLYQRDSIQIVAQGLASDLITLALAIPVTLIALYFSVKKSFKGSLVLTGMLGYFLYTYTSYVFLWNYNRLFIVYVMIMSLSFFAFVLRMVSFDLSTVKNHFTDRLNIKTIAGFQLFVTVMIGLLWLSKLTPTWFGTLAPFGLEHYTTLVIQALDLGFVLPVAVISAIMLIRRQAMGYLLSSVVLVKDIALLTSITAMSINMMMQGVQTSVVEVGIFFVLDVLGIFVFALLLSQIKKSKTQNALSEY